MKKSIFPNTKALGTFFRDTWDRLKPLPGGNKIFSKIIGSLAPYTGSVRAEVLDLKKGYAKVQMRDRRAVRNHLQSVHAIALVNLAELAGNAALSYSMPDDARFIVAGLSIDYLKKARGTITATSFCPVPENADRQEYEVPVELFDAQGDVVAKATLRTLVGPIKS